MIKTRDKMNIYTWRYVPKDALCSSFSAINGRVSLFGADVALHRVELEQKQEKLALKLWQTLKVSFPRINKYTKGKKNKTQYDKTDSQYNWQFFKKITGKSYSQNGFAKVSNIFSNKFSGGFIDNYHSKEL